MIDTNSAEYRARIHKARGVMSGIIDKAIQLRMPVDEASAMICDKLMENITKQDAEKADQFRTVFGVSLAIADKINELNSDHKTVMGAIALLLAVNLMLTVFLTVATIVNWIY